MNCVKMKYSILISATCLGLCLAQLPNDVISEENPNRTDNIEIYEKIKAVVTGFKDCIYEFLDGERIANEFSKSNDVCNNTVNSVQSPQVNLCLKEKIDVFKLSLSKDERKRWSTINNILLKIVELISENESNEVIGFVENSGINCLNSRLEEVEKCFGDSNNNYYSLGLNHFHIDSCKNYDKIQSCVTRELQENCSDASIDSFFKFARSSLCSDNKIIRSRRSLRRVVRNIGMGDKVPHVKNQLIKNCKSQEKLNQSLENMEACLGTETMFITPRNEYIDHINTCSKNVTKLLDECLPEKLRYFPKFIVELIDSVVRLLYDDFKEIALGLGPCIDKLKSTKSENDYKNCMHHVVSDNDDTIPESKAAYCSKFLEIAKCWTKQINETCPHSADLDKFSKDYTEAMKKPCDS